MTLAHRAAKIQRGFLHVFYSYAVVRCAGCCGIYIIRVCEENVYAFLVETFSPYCHCAVNDLCLIYDPL